MYFNLKPVLQTEQCLPVGWQQQYRAQCIEQVLHSFLLQIISRLLGFEASQAHKQGVNTVALAQQRLICLMALQSQTYTGSAHQH